MEEAMSINSSSSTGGPIPAQSGSDSAPQEALFAGVLSKPEQERVYALAYSYYGQARYLDALKLFWYLVTKDISEAKYYKAMGACLQMLKNFQNAIECYGMASILNIDDPTPLFYLAECALADGAPVRAMHALTCFIAATDGMQQHARLRERAVGMLAEISSKNSQSQ